jgi:hypothetical protein
VQVEDNDAAAYEGRSQSVTVTAATAYIASCYIKAGTSALARISLDGTACNVSGLSTSTWTRATCADASSSGVSIAVQVLVGNATTDTGTVIYGGCQVEAGSFASSYIPTAGAAATRNAEAASFGSLSMPLWPSSMAASINVGPSLSGSYLTLAGASVTGVLSATAATTTRCLYSDGSNTPFASKTSATVSNTVRAWCSPNGAFPMVGEWGGAAMTHGGGSNLSVARTVTGVSFGGDAVLSRVCLDPDPSRCR